MSLTRPQFALLRDIARPGPPMSWRDACVSGNRAPMFIRLCDLGLITEPPFRVTAKGVIVLSELIPVKINSTKE
jgi:hypothetical protein